MHNSGEKDKILLKELAKQLYLNHCYSFIDPKTQHGMLHDIGEENEEYKRIVIVVVGAAASFEAGVMDTKKAVKSLKGLLKINELRFQADIKRLSSVYRLNEMDFETQLLAISHQNDTDLRDMLPKLFTCQYCPIGSYEILAHMFKHRFINAIVNFNFDELLDQAIDDEMIGRGYYKIISDGDCPVNLLNAKTPQDFDLPVYIKPHGTVSHPSSLRFTREDYFGLPKEIGKVIENLFSMKETPVTMLCIGFGMQSFEFNQFALKSAKSSEIYHIDLHIPLPDPPLENYIQKLIRVEDKDDVSRISKHLNDLWEQVLKLFKPYYKPRNIARHEIVYKLLVKDNNSSCKISDDKTKIEIRETSEFKEKYLKNRTLLELLFSIANYKGLVNISSLKMGRSGKYLGLLINENIEFKTFPEMCNILGFSANEYGNELFTLLGNDNKIVSLEDFQEWIERFFVNYETIKKRLDVDLFDKCDSEFIDFFKSKILEIYRGEEVEICYGLGHLYEMVFKRPEPIRTYTALKWNTMQLLENDWNNLFIIAETGEWITNDNIIEKFQKKKTSENPRINLYLILSDSSWKTTINKKLKDVADIEFKELPWWAHNKHITLCLKDEKPVSGIYFTRRMRSPYIEAIKLFDQNDCILIADIFYAYWSKAMLREEQCKFKLEAINIETAKKNIHVKS